jgi:hypothetical protein
MVFAGALASSQGARIQTSRSSSVVRITGIALGWIGSTTAEGPDYFASEVSGGFLTGEGSGQLAPNP